jgi:hypothetical protein
VRKQLSGYNGRMEFFPANPDVERLAPGDTHLLDLRAEPYPDGKRLQIHLELTPFQQRPYLDLTLTDSTREVIAPTAVVEPVAYKFDHTLQIRKPFATRNAPYKPAVILSFSNLGEIGHCDLNVEIPSPTV